MKRFYRAVSAIIALLVLFVSAAMPVAFNPQEVGLVVESFLVDQDAAVIGLMTAQDSGPHSGMTSSYRASHIGPHDEAQATVDISIREEWQAWRGEQRITAGSDDFVIEYKGFMLDTRTDASADPTYDIRWESVWYKNDPTRTTPFAEGGGVFEFTDPEFSFDIEVDPFNPSSVVLSGSASTKLWGLVDVTISGSKDFGTGLLKASAGVSADIPYVSDYLGSFASADFNFEYNQKTGAYSSAIDAQVLFGLFNKQATVNKGKVVAPAVAQPPEPIVFPMYVPPPYAKAPLVQANGGLNAPEPLAAPVAVGLPGLGSTTGTTEFFDAYNPYGSLADELLDLSPLNFNNPNQLVHHPGFIDPITFPPPFDDPITPPGGGLGFSFMDPAAGGAEPLGIFLAPTQTFIIPEPATVLVVWFAIGCLLHRSNLRRSA